MIDLKRCGTALMIDAMLLTLQTGHFVTLILPFVLAKGQGQPKVCLYANLTESTILLDVLARLDWKSVAILHDDTTDALNTANDVEPALHGQGVQTCVTKGMLTRDSAMDFHSTNISNFLVLGSFVYMKQIFETMSMAAEQKGIPVFLFTTQWLTVISEGDLEMFKNFALAFENVAVVVRTQTCRLALRTLRHVRDKSEMGFVSRLPPVVSPLTRDRILPNPSYGLGNRTIRVILKERPFTLFTTTGNNKTVYQGFLMDIFNELTHRANFSYQLVPPTDEMWGQRMDNGQWNGPIGMLTRKEADLAVGYFTISSERSSVADPTTPYSLDYSVVVFKHHKAAGVKWNFFLHPFQTMIYVVISSSLALVLLLMLVLGKCLRGLAGRERISSQREATLLWVNFEILLAGLVNRTCYYESDSSAGRVLLLTWLLLGLLLASAYSSQLTSSLTVNKDALPFSSLAQLLKQDAYTWGVCAGTAQESLVKDSTRQDYKEFYGRILEFAKKDPSVLSTDVLVQKAKVNQEKYAFFVESTVTALGGPGACQLTLLPEKFMTVSFGFYLQKNSPYTKIISDKINHMVDSGLVEHWKQKWMPDSQRCESDNERGSREIGLDDTLTAFCLAVLGLGMAGIVLGIEYLCRCRSNSVSKRLPA